MVQKRTAETDGDVNALYESMQKHPGTGPVMDLLELVEPVDEFSRALCLVRDCFSPSDTLRVLSRGQLRGMLQARIDLVNAFHARVVQAARDNGWAMGAFEKAVANLEPAKFDKLKAAFTSQMNELMMRPLETKT